MEVYGADINGIDGQLVRFTATKDEGRRGVTLLGLAQRVVREGFQRAAKAIETLDGDWSRILSEGPGYTIDLSPAETMKTSSGLALPIAVMLLQASILQNLDSLKDQIARLEEAVQRAQGGGVKEDVKKRILERMQQLIAQRDLALKYRRRLQNNNKTYLLIGTLNIVTGRISAPLYSMFGMIAAARPGFTVIVPEDSEAHASIVAAGNSDITTLKAADLQEVWNVILGIAPPRKTSKSEIVAKPKQITRHIPDLRHIEGVSRAKRAMAIALAGGHNILLVGPPGQGKGMLALAAVNLLPDLNREEMFELNKVYSAKGDLRENEVIVSRPYQEFVLGSTGPALFGGGTRPVPGLVSLSHKGVLFIDEINQQPGPLIEKLRNVLNDRIHKVQRVHGTIEFPCHFMLVTAMNPCKCGWYAHYVCPECNRTFFAAGARCEDHPDAALRRKCHCSQRDIEAFRCKLSGPLLDRIDLKVLVSSYDNTQLEQKAYASTTIKHRIKLAREVQRARYIKTSFGDCNAAVPDRAQFEEFTPQIEPHVSQFVAGVFRKLDTKRMEVKVLLVARTIADYEESRVIRIRDVKEAVDLMGLDHEYFRSLSS